DVRKGAVDGDPPRDAHSSDRFRTRADDAVRPPTDELATPERNRHSGVEEEVPTVPSSSSSERFRSPVRTPSGSPSMPVPGGRSGGSGPGGRGRERRFRQPG